MHDLGQAMHAGVPSYTKMVPSCIQRLGLPILSRKRAAYMLKAARTRTMRPRTQPSIAQRENNAARGMQYDHAIGSVHVLSECASNGPGLP